MTVRGIPFEGQDAGEEDYYLLHREAGVVDGLDLTLTGLNWSLAVGSAYASGTMVLNENTPLAGSSTPTTGANPRRDMLVARRTLVPGGGSFAEIALKSGTPAATPTDRQLERELLGTWEEPLFSWQVAGNGAASTSAVRDLRRWYDAGDQRGQFMSLRVLGSSLAVSADLFQVASWSVSDRSNGALSYVNGAIRCNRPGRVRAKALASSNADRAGFSWLQLRHPVRDGELQTAMDDQRQRASGYNEAGSLRQPLGDEFTVVPGDVFSYWLRQQNVAGASVGYDCYLTVTYV